MNIDDLLCYRPPTRWTTWRHMKATDRCAAGYRSSPSTPGACCCYGWSESSTRGPWYGRSNAGLDCVACRWESSWRAVTSFTCRSLCSLATSVVMVTNRASWVWWRCSLQSAMRWWCYLTGCSTTQPSLTVRPTRNRLGALVPASLFRYNLISYNYRPLTVSDSGVNISQLIRTTFLEVYLWKCSTYYFNIVNKI